MGGGRAVWPWGGGRALQVGCRSVARRLQGRARLGRRGVHGWGGARAWQSVAVSRSAVAVCQWTGGGDALQWTGGGGASCAHSPHVAICEDSVAEGTDAGEPSQS